MRTTAVARSFLPLAVAVAPAISKLINYNSSQTYDEVLGFVIASPCQLVSCSVQLVTPSSAASVAAASLRRNGSLGHVLQLLRLQVQRHAPNVLCLPLFDSEEEDETDKKHVYSPPLART